MKSRLTIKLQILLLLTTITSYAQVGIGTNVPTETLDVNGTLRVRQINAIAPNASAKDSIMVFDSDGVIKRATADQIVGQATAGNTAVLTDGTVIIGDGKTGNTIRLSQQSATIGQALMWDGTKWTPNNVGSSSNIYTMDGTLTGNRTVTQGSNTLAFTSSATNGFSVDGTTFSIDASNNRVGMGTVAPESPLHVLGVPQTPSLGLAGLIRLASANSRLDFYSRANNPFVLQSTLANNSANEIIINPFGGNVGIGNGSTTPANTLHIGTATVAGTTGIRTPITNAGALGTNANGDIVASAVLTFGDVKTGIQATDHNGWIKLDGRAKSTLTATQQTQATALGIGANLPDATGAYLVQNGTTLGSVGGSNSKTIAQANLPNINLTASSISAGTPTGTITVANTTSTMQSAGNHQHFATGSGWGDFAYSPVGNFGAVFANGGNQGSNPFSYDGAYYNGIADVGATSSNGAHTHTMDAHNHTATFTGTALGTHSHSVPLGGSGTALDVTPRSLSVNTFIYLGN